MDKDMDAQFLCKNCERFNLCQYYDRRKEDSYICKYFHLTNKMEEGQLKQIRDFIVNYIMRDSYVMYSDEARDVGPHHIDLIYVIASLYEELHKQVKGEPYEYMFHWANKVGSWVEDDLFSEEKFKQFLEELQNEHINN